jgi:predicted nuclease of restriction endonuclease-like (RecB) superfamily
MGEIIKDNEYRNWLKELKNKIKTSQIKASISVNTEMILMYWDLGRQIVGKKENTKWGSGFIDQLSKDLKSEFPDMSGFSRTNLFAMKKHFRFYDQSFEIVPQVGGLLEYPDILATNCYQIEVKCHIRKQFLNIK